MSGLHSRGGCAVGRRSLGVWGQRSDTTAVKCTTGLCGMRRREADGWVLPGLLVESGQSTEPSPEQLAPLWNGTALSVAVQGSADLGLMMMERR